jgi:hypothetical protein
MLSALVSRAATDHRSEFTARVFKASLALRELKIRNRLPLKC